MNSPKTVDEYIGSAPEGIRGKLHEIRKAIKETVPEALEKISYKMPYYGYKGRLVYFAFWKEHIAVYAMNYEVIKEFKEELVPYLAEKGTIKIPLDQEVPIGLIKKVVKAQAAFNEAKKGK